MEIFRFRAMNTEITLAAQGESILVNLGFEKAQEFINASERRFTRFSEDTNSSNVVKMTVVCCNVPAEIRASIESGDLKCKIPFFFCKFAFDTLISDEPAFFLTTIPTDGFRANPHTYRH